MNRICSLVSKLRAHAGIHGKTWALPSFDGQTVEGSKRHQNNDRKRALLGTILDR